MVDLVSDTERDSKENWLPPPLVDLVYFCPILRLGIIWVDRSSSIVFKPSSAFWSQPRNLELDITLILVVARFLIQIEEGLIALRSESGLERGVCLEVIPVFCRASLTNVCCCALDAGLVVKLLHAKRKQVSHRPIRAIPSECRMWGGEVEVAAGESSHPKVSEREPSEHVCELP